MNSKTGRFDELKDTSRTWIISVLILVVLVFVLSQMTNRDVYRIEDLQEQIPEQGLVVYEVLEKRELVPQETLDQVAALQPEWEAKKRAKNAAWDAIGPGGKIKDAGWTTPKGRDWKDKLAIFQAVDRQMIGYKHNCAREHGSKLTGTDQDHVWQRYQRLRDNLQNYIDNRRWYEKGAWASWHIALQMILRISAMVLFFITVCLSFSLLGDLVKVLSGDD